MNNRPLLFLPVLALANLLCAQAPGSSASSLPPLQKVDGGTLSEADGNGASRHEAMLDAVQNAILRVNGLHMKSEPGLQARLSVVRKKESIVDSVNGSLELGGLSHQLAGYVLGVEEVSHGEGRDGTWQVRARCIVSTYDPETAPFVVQFAGFSENNRDVSYVDVKTIEAEVFDGDSGRTEEYQPESVSGMGLLDRMTRLLKVVARGPGVPLTGNSDPREAAKAGKELVPTYRIEVSWSPCKAHYVRPKTPPNLPVRQNPVLQGITLEARVRIRDLVLGTVVLEQTIPCNVSAAEFKNGLNAEALSAVVKDAQTRVLQTIYFSLRPPVVLDRQADAASDGAAQPTSELDELAKERAELAAEWAAIAKDKPELAKQAELAKAKAEVARHKAELARPAAAGRAKQVVEVNIPRSLVRELAATCDFQFGLPGTLGDSDWVPTGFGRLVEGGGSTSRFELEPGCEVEPGKTILKPIPKAKK